VAEESQHFDRSALQAVVAAAAEEFDGEIMLLVRDGSKMRLGASESAGLNARMILSQCLRRLNQLEGKLSILQLERLSASCRKT